MLRNRSLSTIILAAAVPETATKERQRNGLAVHPRVGSGTIDIFDFVTACYTERCFRNVLLVRVYPGEVPASKRILSFY